MCRRFESVREVSASLTNHFVPHFNAVYKKQVRAVAPEAWHCLRSYSWPGNVRELKNVIQRAVLMARGGELTADLLPLRIRAAAEVNAAVQPSSDSCRDDP